MGKPRSRDRVAAARDAALAKLAENAGGGALLGAIVWCASKPGWTAPGDVVRDAWRAEGLDPSVDLNEVPDHETSMHRAVAASGGAAAARDCSLVKLDDLRPDGSKVVIVGQWIKNGTAHADTVGVVVLPPGAPCFVEQADPHGLAARIVDFARGRFLGCYTSADLRGAYTKILERWQAAPGKDEGGTRDPYWLPAAGIETIERLQRTIKVLGSGKLSFMQVHDDPVNRAESVDAARTGLEVRLADFARQVAEWKAGIKVPARASTVETQIAKVQELLATGDLYRTILRDGIMTDLESRIASLKADYQAVVLGIEASATRADGA